MLRVPDVAVAERAALSASRLNVPDAARFPAGDDAGASAAAGPWIRMRESLGRAWLTAR
jgi:hypothetical protein